MQNRTLGAYLAGDAQRTKGTGTNRIHLVLFSMQNTTLGPYSAKGCAAHERAPDAARVASCIGLMMLFYNVVLLLQPTIMLWIGSFVCSM
jgi:hypothetical protein